MTRTSRRIALTVYRTDTEEPGLGNASGLAVPTMTGWTQVFVDEFEDAYSSTQQLNPNYYRIHNGESKAHPGESWWHPSHIVVENSTAILQCYKDPDAIPSDEPHRDRQVGAGFASSYLSAPDLDTRYPGFSGLPDGTPRYVMFMWCSKEDKPVKNTTKMNMMTYGRDGTADPDTPSTIYPRWPATGEDDTQESAMGSTSAETRLHYPKENPWTPGTPGTTANNLFTPNWAVDFGKWNIMACAYKAGVSGQGPTIQHWTNDAATTNTMRLHRTRTNAFRSFGTPQRRWIAQTDTSTGRPDDATSGTNWDSVTKPNWYLNYDGGDKEAGEVVVSTYIDWFAIFIPSVGS